MKRFMIAALGTMGLSAAALAGTTTVEFTSSDGNTYNVTFDSDAGTYETSTGDTGTYTMDEATKTLCGESAEDSMCITFDELGDGMTEGFSTGYTTDKDTSGTATVVSTDK